MSLLTILGTSPARFASGVDDFAWFEMTSTPLIALISARRCAAKEADPFDVSIRQKATAFWTISQPDD
jgi:hypothetical protein